MTVTFTRTFEKSLSRSHDRELVKSAAKQLIQAIQNNIKPSGLGLKKLGEDIWEVRVGIRTRVLFLLLPGELRFLLVGNHDEVKKYLKNQ